jgi:hypothetical protein
VGESTDGFYPIRQAALATKDPRLYARFSDLAHFDRKDTVKQAVPVEGPITYLHGSSVGLLWTGDKVP